MNNQDKLAIAKSGVTVLELIVVMTIIAGMFLFSFPYFINIGPLSYLKSEARRLTAMIRYAYELAAGEGCICYLYYDLDNNCYWVSKKKDRVVNSPDILARKRVLPANVELVEVTHPQGKIRWGITHTKFFPYGFVEETSIHLREVNSEKQLSILINPLSGETTIYEGYIERTAQSGRER